jgi:hypothetical protein
MPGYFDPPDDHDEYDEDHSNQQYTKQYLEEIYELLVKISSRGSSLSALKPFKRSELWSQTVNYNTEMYDRYHNIDGIVLNLVTGKFEKKK